MVLNICYILKNSAEMRIRNSVYTTTILFEKLGLDVYISLKSVLEKLLTKHGKYHKVLVTV